MLAMSACSSSPWIISKASPSRYKPGDAVRISLPRAERNRIDNYVNAVGYKHAVATGDIWQAIFIGREGDPVFKVNSATLRQSYDAGGFAARFTYQIDGDCNGYAVQATGSRAASLKIQQALREAVELGVIDAAAKCRSILSGD